MSGDDEAVPGPAPDPATGALKQELLALHPQFREPLEALLADSRHLSARQRLHLTQLQESLQRMEWLLGSLPDGQVAPGANRSGTEVPERLQVEKVLRALATTTSPADSEEFYRYCVRTLAELYDCRYAFIGLIEEGGKQVRTLVVWTGEGYGENFEYDLEGTPCVDVINYRKELIPTGAATLYPDDALLVRMGIDSYFGAPLLSKESGVIGLVSVMDERPMRLNDWTAPVLGVFASRLALELERKSAMDELCQLNLFLEQRVSERTRELEAANRELEAFTYSVSHDLRAPVRSINSFLEIFCEECRDQLPRDALDYLGRVSRAGLKLDDLIDDLLLLSRIGRHGLVMRDVDLTAIACQVLHELREQEPGREVEVRLQAGIGGWGDEGLLRIALQNLLGNAWKYTGKTTGPVIEMGAEERDGATVYYVKDNGVGFDMEYVDQVFEPFRRLHTEEEFEGNGIGMATTQRIIHRHAGELWVESAPGCGTSFFFSLGCRAPSVPRGYGDGRRPKT